MNDSVKTAGRTLDVFEAFAEARAPLTLTELAQRTGTPISSCHALVRTLQARGYLYVLDERRRVYPTRRLLDVARTITDHDPLLEQLRPLLENLRERTGETVILGKRHGEHVVYLDVIEGVHTVRYTARAGDIKPLHSSAIGKAMLGVLPDEELRTLIAHLELARVTPNTLVRAEDLVRDLERGRERGYFVTRGENVVDVMAMAIVRQVAGQWLGVALAGPISRMSQHQDRYLDALADSARKLEALDGSITGRA